MCSTRGGRAALMLLSACAAVLPGCAGKRPGTVVLVTVSGPRADALSGPDLPFLAERARGATVLRDVFTPAPDAAPAVAELMTSVHPLELDIRHGDLARIPARTGTLAERFRQAGYATAAFVGQQGITAETGLARGFQTWRAPRTTVDRGRVP